MLVTLRNYSEFECLGRGRPCVGTSCMSFQVLDAGNGHPATDEKGDVLYFCGVTGKPSTAQLRVQCPGLFKPRDTLLTGETI